jgi:hypothetical protein
MSDESEYRCCTACGGPVGPDGRSLALVPPRPALRVKAPPSRQIEEVKDDITPTQRFERAIQRRDAAASKRPSRKGKGGDTQR